MSALSISRRPTVAGHPDMPLRAIHQRALARGTAAVVLLHGRTR